jgi:autotransporter-associated beta strand protein
MQFSYSTLLRLIMSSLFHRTLSGVLTRTALAMVVIASASSSLAVELFWKTDGTTGDWITGPWSLTNGGTLNQTWTAGDSARFTANSLVSPTPGSFAVFDTITVDAGVSVTGSDGDDFNPFSTGGGVGTFDVGAGGVLDLGSAIFWDNAPGTALVKNGEGILSLRGRAPSGLDNTPYSGGFTMNGGTVIIRTNEALGTGPLVINGGTIMASGGSRTAMSSSVAINGNFTIGGTTTGLINGDAQANRTITFSAPTVNLGAGNRTITIGNDVINTFSGVVDNGAVTVTNAIVGENPVPGSLAFTNANTYSGGTFVSAGQFRIGNDAAAGTGTIHLNGGVLNSVNAAGAQVTYTVSNPIEVLADSVVTAVGGTGSSTRANLSFTGPVTGSARLIFDSLFNTSVNTGAIYVYDDLSDFSGVIEVNHRDTANSGTGTRTMGTLRFLAPSLPSATYGGLSVQDYSSQRFEFNGAINFASNGVSTRFNDEESEGTTDVMVVQIGEVAGDGGFLLTNGGTSATFERVVLEVGHLGTDVTFDGGMRGTRTDFVKVGAGTLTFGGRNAFTGTTTIRSGRLIVTDDAPNVNMSPNGDELMGDGIFDNSVTADASTDFLTYATVTEGIDTVGTIQELQDGDRVTLSYGTSIGLSASAEWFVVNASGSGLARTFQLSATEGGTPADITAAGTSVRVYPLSTLGAGFSPIQVGDTGSTAGHLPTGASETVGLLTGAAATIDRPINVNNVGAGTTLGGTTDHSSTFTGNVTLGKSVELTSAAVTDDNTVTFSGVISGPGAGVTKVGAGSVTLSGLNTYTGNTAVEEGTLSITNNDTLANAANVLLSSGVLLDLDFTGSDTINSLFINGNLAASGTWGSFASSAAHKSALFDGLGMLNVMVGAAGQIGDFNGDGMVNLADYTVWRDNLGGPESALANPGNNNGIVDAGDYTAWKSNFGAGSGSVQALSAVAVPEPTGIAVLLGLVGIAVAARRIRVL